jgi:thioredoxin-related protein/tetratricopeptide (TPR) repeat protein
MKHVTLHGLVLLAAAAILHGCESGQDERSGRVDASRTSQADASGSSQEKASATASTNTDRPGGIAWFDGDVESAFQQSRTDGKPVFLYWGAVWCPYCADLKAHVFSRRDFQQKLELFVPVYLDGDDPGAQRWGDELGVWGYPTVLVLAGDRSELARIAGGMDLAVYADVLDLVLSDVAPLRDVLTSLPISAAALSPADCKRLAFNGWALDDSLGALDIDVAAALAEAVERCPVDARVERARLTAIAASYAAAAEAGSVAEGSESSPLLARLVDDVREILAEPDLSARVVDALQYLDADFFVVAKQLDRQASAQLLEQWSATMDAAADDARRTAGDRLTAVRSKLEAIKVLSAGGEIPAPLAQAARHRIDDALDRARGTAALPGVVNGAVNLLVTMDDPERAYEIAERAMHDARTPYYYMADLAWLDEQMGRTDAAVAWLQRAYRESSGDATRFQWGTNYVRGLIRMQPDDEDAVRNAALAVLDELEGPDRIYRRTRTRLDALDAALREWNRDGVRDEPIAAIRHRAQRICDELREDEQAAAAACRGFLSGSDTA